MAGPRKHQHDAKHKRHYCTIHVAIFVMAVAFFVDTCQAQQVQTNATQQAATVTTGSTVAPAVRVTPPATSIAPPQGTTERPDEDEPELGGPVPENDVNPGPGSTTLPPDTPSGTVTPASKQKEENNVLPPEVEPLANCSSGRGDVFILMESSQRISTANFAAMKASVAALVDLLPPFGTSNKVRLAVTLFGNRVQPLIRLNQFGSNKDVLKKAILAAPHMKHRGRSNIVGGLRAIQRQLSRRNAPRLLLVLTSGTSSRAQLAPRIRLAANALRVAHVVSFAMGIGPRANSRAATAELRALVGSAPHPNRRIMRVPAFSDLRDRVIDVARVICSAVGPCPQPTTPFLGPCKNNQKILYNVVYKRAADRQCVSTREPKDTLPCTTTPQCDARTNLIFLLDSSSSIGVRDFGLAKQFLQSIVEAQRIERKQMHVALVQFSTLAKLEFNLHDYNTSAGVMRRIGLVSYQRGATRTGAGLRLIRERILDHLPRRSDAARTVIVLVTDGQSNAPAITLDEAMLIRDMGVKIVAVGVGPNVNQKELKQLSGNNYLHARRYHELIHKLQLVTQKACGDVLTECRAKPQFYMSPCTHENQQTKFRVTYEATRSACRRVVTPLRTLACTAEVPCGEEPERLERSKTCVGGMRPVYRITWENTPCGCVRRRVVAKSISCDPITNKDNPECLKVDVAFVLDDSSSITFDVFKAMKNFTYNMIGSFGKLTPRSVRVALVTYNEEALVHLPFNAYTGIEGMKQMLRYVKTLPYTRGRTYLGRSLRRVRERVLRYARRDVPTAVFLLTDGQSKDREVSPVAEARLIRKYSSHIKLFIVGAGMRQKPQVLRRMAGEEPVYNLGDLTKLRSAMSESYTVRHC